MKNITGIICVVFFLASCASNSVLPSGAIQKGSLSNQQLIRDAMVGVVSKVATLGCSNVESFEPYVLAMPSGTPGSRSWKELWVVKGCETEYPVKVQFQESGLGAANYTVE